MQFAAIVPKSCPKTLSKFHPCGVLLRVESAGSVGKVGSVNDVVALENGARLVATDRHRYALLHAKPAKVADATPSQIVEEQIGNARASANRLPDFAEACDWFAVLPREHEVIRLLGDDASGQQGCNFSRHHDHGAFAVLRRSRFQSNRATRQVNLLDAQ